MGFLANFDLKSSAKFASHFFHFFQNLEKCVKNSSKNPRDLLQLFFIFSFLKISPFFPKKCRRFKVEFWKSRKFFVKKHPFFDFWLFKKHTFSPIFHPFSQFCAPKTGKKSPVFCPQNTSILQISHFYMTSNFWTPPIFRFLHFSTPKISKFLEKKKVKKKVKIQKPFRVPNPQVLGRKSGCLLSFVFLTQILIFVVNSDDL